MNFNEEFVQEMKNTNLECGRIINIPLEEKSTLKDMAELERKIAIRTHENEIMMVESMKYAKSDFI